MKKKTAAPSMNAFPTASVPAASVVTPPVVPPALSPISTNPASAFARIGTFAPPAVARIGTVAPPAVAHIGTVAPPPALSPAPVANNGNLSVDLAQEAKNSEKFSVDRNLWNTALQQIKKTPTNTMKNQTHRLCIRNCGKSVVPI